MNRLSPVVLLALSGLLLAGCAADQPRRIHAGGVEAITTLGIDLQDFKNTAGQLTQAMLANPRILNFAKQNGGRLPVINVGAIVNKSDLSIDMAQVAGRINEDLLNSGLVEIVANDAGAVSASREDAYMNDRDVNNDARADFYLEGVIGLLTAKYQNTREKTYTFQIRLNNRQRRTVFQKTVDMSKQGESGRTLGW